MPAGQFSAFADHNLLQHQSKEHGDPDKQLMYEM